MVKGVRFCLLGLVFYVFVKFPTVDGLGRQIRNIVYNNNGRGTYSFEYENIDGTFRKEDGGLVANSKGVGFVVRGEYAYIDPTGQYHYVRYIADSHGYQPKTHDGIRYNDRRIV